MELRRLPASEPAVRRFVEELWLPYHRELEATVDAHALSNDVDLVAAEVAFRLDRLRTERYRVWIAVEDVREGEQDSGGPVALADVDCEFAGFVTTDVDESPPVFDVPDRLAVGDVFVREPYRGTGLGRRLLDRAAERAREAGCSELVLDVDVDNERALGFYRALGFETLRRRMTVDADEL